MQKSYDFMGKMKAKLIVIQASSTTWSGGGDLCMNLMDGRPILYHTINRFVENFQTVKITVIAPMFDFGNMDFIKTFFQDGVVSIYYGHDESPLRRMLDVTEDLDANDFIIRVNGLNFCADIVAAESMLQRIQESDADSIRFPDNFPSLFTSDIYRVGSLRDIYAELLEDDGKYQIHPKYYMSSMIGYKSLVFQPDMLKYTDEYLLSIREKSNSSIYEKRIEIDHSKLIKSGDTISYHYELAARFIEEAHYVVDLGCGNGFGFNFLSDNVEMYIGVDNDQEVIDHAIHLNGQECVKFLCSDVLDLPFEQESVDAVLAFEIIEHVDSNSLLRNIFRVLKPGGILCLSTPQNSLGHIPSTPDHIYEFSLDEISAIVSEFFLIEKIIGIKQGVIFFDNDPVGANTFLVARKPRD